MRLIDKDRLLKAIDNYDKECEDILIEPSAYSIYSIIKDCPTVDQWHYPSKGEYPTHDGRYFVARYDAVTKTCFTDILWFENKCWWNRQHTGDYAVYAWMPLPETPKEEA